ncbi:MAG: dihydropteroate synthase, partial [Rikenellaceae bacterium]|nr:dihydropteroate synthase [Rikenellaceae bacterium]
MRLRDRLSDLSHPQVMAIVNITPDSFFDASRTWDEQSIAARVQKVITEGASIIDIGGYSSRPGADEVTLEEELSRVERALAVVKDVAAGVSVSVDTFRSRVAQLAIEMMGEVIINDISAGEADPAMVDVVAHYGVPYVAMHMRGTPQTMQGRTAYERGVVEEVTAYFDRRTEWLISRGVKDIIVD